MTIGTGLRRKQQKKKRGLAVVLVILLLMGIAAGWRLFDISEAVEKMKSYFSTAEMHSAEGKSVRGTIYDRTYKEMAVSLPRVSVYARPREIMSVADAAKTLAPIFGVDADTLLAKLRGEDLRIWLAKDITDKQEEEVKAANIKGVYLHQEYSRYYPLKDVAAHLVGFVQDDIGLSGVEYYYDRLVQKMLGRADTSGFHASAGQNMLLTLDLKVQAILENLVENIAAGRQNVRIGAYAMDAYSGALIASVQLPSFDPNRYRIYAQALLENLLVRPMVLPPLFRSILRDSAAIESQYELRGKVHPWSISAQQLSLGSELRLWEKLGLTAAPSPEFGNNEKQQMRSEYLVVSARGRNDFGTVPESLSPLSLLAAFSSLTNGGGKVEPYVVQAVSDPGNDEEFQLHPDVHEKVPVEVVSREVSQEISRMIGQEGVACELGGTIIHDAIQVEVGSNRGFAHMSNALYLAVVPVERAELTVLITVQDGSLQAEEKKGFSVADPVKELSAVLPRIAVLQKVGKSIVGVAEPEEGKNGNYPMHPDRAREVVRSSLGQDSDELVDPGEMPELVGLSLRKSLRLLQHATCRIHIYGTGRVVEQKPLAGTSLAGVKECVIRMQKQEDVSLEALEEKTSKRK